MIFICLNKNKEITFIVQDMMNLILKHKLSYILYFYSIRNRSSVNY